MQRSLDGTPGETRTPNPLIRSHNKGFAPHHSNFHHVVPLSCKPLQLRALGVLCLGVWKVSLHIGNAYFCLGRGTKRVPWIFRPSDFFGTTEGSLRYFANRIGVLDERCVDDLLGLEVEPRPSWIRVRTPIKFNR